MLLPDALLLFLLAVAHELLPLQRVLEFESRFFGIHLGLASAFLLLLPDGLVVLLGFLGQPMRHAIMRFLDHLKGHLRLLIFLKVRGLALLGRLSDLLLQFGDLLHFPSN